jgi:plasmid stability protein
MPTLTVRDLDESVYQGLKETAASHDRSMEAEAREILARAIRSAGWWDRWVAAVADARGEELELPPREAPRQVEL